MLPASWQIISVFKIKTHFYFSCNVEVTNPTSFKMNNSWQDISLHMFPHLTWLSQNSSDLSPPLPAWLRSLTSPIFTLLRRLMNMLMNVIPVPTSQPWHHATIHIWEMATVITTDKWKESEMWGLWKINVSLNNSFARQRKVSHHL